MLLAILFIIEGDFISRLPRELACRTVRYQYFIFFAIHIKIEIAAALLYSQDRHVRILSGVHIRSLCFLVDSCFRVPLRILQIVDDIHIVPFNMPGGVFYIIVHSRVNRKGEHHDADHIKHAQER